MSRASGGDVIEIRPSSDMYTVLVAIAILAELIAFIALMTRAGEIFVDGKGLFS